MEIPKSRRWKRLREFGSWYFTCAERQRIMEVFPTAPKYASKDDCQNACAIVCLNPMFMVISMRKELISHSKLTQTRWYRRPLGWRWKRMNRTSPYLCDKVPGWDSEFSWYPREKSKWCYLLANMVFDSLPSHAYHNHGSHKSTEHARYEGLLPCLPTKYN